MFINYLALLQLKSAVSAALFESFLLILAWLVRHAVRGLASRLAGGLAFAASAVFRRFAHVARNYRLNSAHLEHLDF
jgi:hypothetical protein